MPVADTEFLFALNPRDKKHEKALKTLSIKDLKVPDTALLEFQAVLRARGRTAADVAKARLHLSRYLVERLRRPQR
ncbi:MAG: hypothetical protein QXX87_01400 [Candidatus Jordarchaeales archaeon]